MQTASKAPAIVTTSDLAAASPAELAAYRSQLNPQQRQALDAQMSAQRAQSNADFLMRSLLKRTTCPPVSGGISQAYTAGQQLIYNLPTVGSAFAKALLITVNVTVTLAAGTSAVYALNAGAPLTLFDNIEVQYDNAQVKLRPYILKYLKQLAGFQRPAPGAVIAGQKDTTVQNALYSAFPVAVGANTWSFVFRVPLNPIHEHSPAGLLPIMGEATKGQVFITCAPNAFGPDPILNTIVETGGTGGSLTSITGTVKAEVEYLDGTNLWSPTPLGLDLTGEPTAQYVIDTPLQPLTAGSTVRQKIYSLNQHYYVLATVVDGNQSSSFATIGNVLGFELDMDSAGQNKFWQYGQGTNLSVNDWYQNTRDMIGQDLDEGIFPLVAAPVAGQANPSNREGTQVLNMNVGGWPDVHHGWQLSTVGGVAGINPRVEIHLVSLNMAGLLRA